MHHIQSVPKNLLIEQICAVGLNFTMDMTWGRLILLSRSKKRPKNTFQAQVVPTEPVHHGSKQHFISTFYLGHPVHTCECTTYN